MSYLFLMGRGIKGTGNTKYAIEFSKYLDNIGEDNIIIAGDDRKWNRRKSHNNNIVEYSFKKQFEIIEKECNKYDTVYILSVPAKNYEEEIKDKFLNLIKNLYNNGKAVNYIQVDHNSKSITRNFYADEKYLEFFNYIDHIITHSMNGSFKKFCDKNNIETNNFICTNNELNGINGLNFNEYIKYWKPFEEKTYKSIKFLGRSAPWKGPWLLRDLHTKYFKDAGYITSAEGIEQSIQSVNEIYKCLHPRIVRDDVVFYSDEEHERNKPIYFMPPYVNTEALERLSKCQFGIELLLLKDNMLGDVIEYCMLEYIAVGVIPIFRKRYGEMFKVNGKSLCEYGEETTGTIFLDENNVEETLKKLDKISSDKDLYNTYRKNAFKFYSSYMDSKVIYKNLINLTKKEI